MKIKKCLILVLTILLSMTFVNAGRQSYAVMKRRSSDCSSDKSSEMSSDEESEKKDKDQSLCRKRRRLDVSTAAKKRAGKYLEKYRLAELGLRGIDNFNMSCFVNAAIQQLYRYEEFKKYIQSLDIAKIEKADFENESEFTQIPALIKCLKYVFAYLDNDESCNEVDFNKYLKQVRCIIMGDDVAQGDANEFMARIFRRTHFSGRIYQKHELSYRGELLTTCYENEPTIMFNLNLNDEISTVQGCLDKYFSETTLDADNMYHSEKYGKIQAQERILLTGRFQDLKTCEMRQIASTELPQTLILNLSRYQYSKRSHRKIFTKIKLDLTLDLTTYCDDTVGGSKQYKLVGVICQTGRYARSGHYLSYVRQDDQWYLIDDESILRVDPAVLTHDDLTQNAYVLRYERVSEVAAEESEQKSSED